MAQKPISVIAAVGVAGILTLSVLAAISSTNQAFAQVRTSTKLSLEASPQEGSAGGKATLRVSLSGVLYEEVAPHSWRIMTGAPIHIKGTGEGKELTEIQSPEGFKIFVDLAPGTHEIQAYFPGDATHKSVTDKTVVTVTF